MTFLYEGEIVNWGWNKSFIVIFWIFWMAIYTFGKLYFCFPLKWYLADPGKARGCSTNSLVINSLSHPFPPTALRRRHAQMVKYRAYSYKIDYVIVIKSFPNTKGHQNPISGSKVTAILLKRGGFGLLVKLQQWRVCACSLRGRLVSWIFMHWIIKY